MNLRLGRRIALLLGPALFLIVVWQVTPLKQAFEPDRVVAMLADVQQAWWSPFVVIAVSALACLLMAPLTLMLIVHGTLYDLPFSFLVAESAMLLAAGCLYMTGLRAGEGVFDRSISPELRQRIDAMGARGVVGLAALRWLPVAHFGLLNMGLGALRVPLPTFVLSTVLGQTPIVAMWVVFGDRLRSVLAHADVRAVGLWLAALLATIL
ncbi:MAG: VTT domain-containing protein, partial [Myxococcota bacterium]